MRESGKISAFHVLQLQTSGSWLCSWSGRHDEAVRFYQFVAQLPASVMNEYIVQTGVLYGKRLHGDTSAHCCFHQLRGSAGSITSQHPVHARTFMLNRSDPI